jgi:hypothetical protein
VKAAWARTPSGYALEFCIPAPNLSRDRLAAGKRMGLNLVLRRSGEVVEQFSDTSPFRSVASSPVYWGQVSLSGE